jgi:hypothetical protein
MNTNMNKTQLRTIQYWFEDGIVEITVGILLMLLAAFFYIDAIMPDSLMTSLFFGSFVLVLLGSFYVAGKVITWLKEHITYPRTGYVSYRQKGNRKRRMMLALVIGMAVAAMLAFIVINRPFGLNIMPIATGMVIALVSGLIGFRTGLPRFYTLAAFGLVLGTSITVSGIGGSLGLAMLYAAAGLAYLCVGLLTLNHYLQMNPTPAEAGNDQ